MLHHCPFQEVAAQDPQTVCQLHLGLAEGIAAALGSVTVVGMEIHDPYRAGYRLELHRPAPTDPNEAAPRDRVGTA